MFEHGKVLVWLDDQSDFAVLAGCLQQLEEKQRLDIHFVSVVSARTRLKWLEPVDQQELTNALVDSRLTLLRRRLADHHIAFDADKLHILVGKAVPSVCKFAQKRDYDLVVKAADAGQRTSTEDMTLLRHCHNPVLLVKSGAAPIQRICAAVDINDEMEFQFNQSILATAKSAADSFAATVDLVSCWEFEYEADLRDSPFYGQNKARIDRAVEAEEQRLQQELTAMAGSHADNCHLLKGQAVQELSAYVEAQRIDLVVMGTLARRGLQGWIIGNTAEQLLPEISCSILALKPENVDTENVLKDA